MSQRARLGLKRTITQDPPSYFHKCNSMTTLIRAINSKSITGFRTTEEEIKTPQVPVLNIEGPRTSTRASREENLTSITDYTFGREIGKGPYATVKLATFKPTQQKVAIKTYEKAKLYDPQRRRNVNREVQILKKLEHPSILRFLDRVETSKDLHLVTEFIQGQSLQMFMKKKKVLSEGEARPLFRDILVAVEYCHQKNVVHRDLKLENILLDGSNTPKLIDFGFSTCMSHDKKFRLFCGTPNYMAPEIVSHKEYAGSPADVWALGVLLYVLVTGSFPFKGQNDREIYRKVQRGNFIIPQTLSTELNSLLRSLLTLDPDARPSVKQVLGHEWFLCQVAEETET